MLDPVWCPICGVTLKEGMTLPCYPGTQPDQCEGLKLGIQRALDRVEQAKAASKEDAFELPPQGDPGDELSDDEWERLCREAAEDRNEEVFVYDPDWDRLFRNAVEDLNREEASKGLPDSNPKTLLGIAKPPISAIPPVAILQLGQAMKDGRTKYGPMNWRNQSITASVYYDAAGRHLMAWFDGEDHASDSGVHHLAHAMACCAILLDAMQQGTLNDDRATPGKFSELVAELTKKAA